MKRKGRRIIPKSARGGDCYLAAAEWMLDNAGDDLRLVHAEVTGRGALAGLSFGHAWVENLDSGFAFDVANGKFTAAPIAVYRAAARIVNCNVFEYTAEQVRARLDATGNYGPWDLKTRSGL